MPTSVFHEKKNSFLQQNKNYTASRQNISLNEQHIPKQTEIFFRKQTIKKYFPTSLQLKQRKRLSNMTFFPRKLMKIYEKTHENIK